jgi:hypothetical protein
VGRASPPARLPVPQRLLDKSLPPALAHITGLRAVTELSMHDAVSSSAANGKGELLHAGRHRWPASTA